MDPERREVAPGGAPERVAFSVVLPAFDEEQGLLATLRYFWPALHELPDYRGRFSLPVTEPVAEGVLCLPLHSRMEPEVLDRIEAALRRVARRSR